MTVSLSESPSQDHRLFTSRDLRPPNFSALKPPREIKGGHRASVRCLGWNTDGRRLASAGVDKVVRVWTPERSLELRSSIELKGHTETVNTLAWDPTHPERLATAGHDSTVRLWDIRSGSSIFTTHTPGVNIYIAFHPKGHLIAVGNRDDQISLIDVRAGGKLLGTVRPSPEEVKEEINEITWSNSGAVFVATTGSGCVRILDSRSHNEVNPPKVASESASALAKGAGAATDPAEVVGGTASLAESGQGEGVEGATSMDVDEVEKKEGTAAAAAASQITPAMAVKQSLTRRIPWDLIYTLQAHTATIFCAQFDPLGRYLATASADSTIGCWSIPEFQSVWMAGGGDLNFPPRSLSFSHDGEFVAAGGEDPYIWVGSTVDGSTVHRLPVAATTNILAWNPAKHLLAYAGDEKNAQEGTIRIWGL